MARPKRDKLVMVRMTEFEKDRAEGLREHLQKTSIPDLIRYLIEFSDFIYSRDPNHWHGQ